MPYDSQPESPIQGGVERVFKEDSFLAPDNECGPEGNADRIYGGQITDIDEFPWLALLGYRTRVYFIQILLLIRFCVSVIQGVAKNPYRSEKRVLFLIV